MTVATLLSGVRYQLSDELKAGYSDAELITYLNQTEESVFATLMNAESNLAMKKTTLTLTSGEVALPTDFSHEEALKRTTDTVASEGTFRSSPSKLESVPPYATVSTTTYKIIGDTLYSDNDSIDLYYYFMPEPYTATTNTLNMPVSFQNLYRQMIKFLALNSDEFDTSIEQALMMKFESKIMSIAGKRGSSNPRKPMPFKV